MVGGGREAVVWEICVCGAYGAGVLGGRTRWAAVARACVCVVVHLGLASTSHAARAVCTPYPPARRGSTMLSHPQSGHRGAPTGWWRDDAGWWPGYIKLGQRVPPGWYLHGYIALVRWDSPMGLHSTMVLLLPP